MKMKKDVVLLTELLVADDKFNAEFFSAATEEQMYALAKTKFPDFNRDDFSQFLQKLQKASDLCEQKLLPEELAEISGGAGGIGKQIASVMLTLTAGFGLAGATPVETDAAMRDFYTLVEISDESNQEKFATYIDRLSEKLSTPNIDRKKQWAQHAQELLNEIGDTFPQALREAFYREVKQAGIHLGDRLKNARDCLKKWSKTKIRTAPPTNPQWRNVINKKFFETYDEAVKRAKIELEISQEYSFSELQRNPTKIIDTLRDGKIPGHNRTVKVTNRSLAHIIFGSY